MPYTASAGADSNLIRILGRERKVVAKAGNEYVMYKGALMELSEARKLGVEKGSKPKENKKGKDEVLKDGKVLYQSRWHKVHEDSRGKYITKKGVRVPLADIVKDSSPPIEAKTKPKAPKPTSPPKAPVKSKSKALKADSKQPSLKNNNMILSSSNEKAKARLGEHVVRIVDKAYAQVMQHQRELEKVMAQGYTQDGVRMFMGQHGPVLPAPGVPAKSGTGGDNEAYPILEGDHNLLFTGKPAKLARPDLVQFCAALRLSATAWHALIAVTHEGADVHLEFWADVDISGASLKETVKVTAKLVLMIAFDREQLYEVRLELFTPAKGMSECKKSKRIFSKYAGTYAFDL